MTACSKQEPPPPGPDFRPVKVKEVLLGGKYQERVLPGEVQASDRAVLSFQVAGEIESILVRPGDEVKKGDVLAQLDDEVYQQQLEVAQAEYNLAKVLFERSAELVKRGVISKNDFDKSKSNYTVATAARDRAQNNYDYTKLYAPYDGLISVRHKEEFEFVQAKESILGIQVENLVDVNFQLPEQYIGSYQLRMQHQTAEPHTVHAQVNFSGKDHWFDAVVTELSTVADKNTGSYTMVLRLPMPEHINAFPGMTAKVKLQVPTSDHTQTPAIHDSALVEEDGQQFVFVLRPDQKKVEKIAVTVTDGKLQSGLKDGDLLVIAGAAELADQQSAVRWVKERGL
ncbi:efflux RND transporter periplasmic adaptor subunit [Motilimonas pumila]|uniref:Efflux RND transporter periplasmic adaptor subunit n=2 Tax=Motilimonas pumila TaxID=2303987 RepID=A0A418YDT2_9GAMM|nr:efflux RND transporter periplasmic adaptor subunit [Motilimonas pumila]